MRTSVVRFGLLVAVACCIWIIVSFQWSLGRPQASPENNGSGLRPSSPFAVESVQRTEVPNSTVGQVVTRGTEHGNELFGVATADLRYRVSGRLNDGETRAAAGEWQDREAPLFVWSDRRRAQVLVSGHDEIGLSDGRVVSGVISGKTDGVIDIVCWTPPPLEWVYYVERVDSQGQFLVRGVEPGCTLRAFDRGRKLVSERHRVNKDTEKMAMTLVRNAHVVAVFDEKGQPLEGALVVGCDERSRVLERSATYSDGQALVPANHTLSSIIADKPGYVASRVAATGGDIRLSLEPGSRLAVVVSRSGRPVKGGALLHNGVVERKSAVRDGRGVLRDVPRTSCEIAFIEGSAKTIAVIPEGVEEFVWSLDEVLTLRGELTDYLGSADSTFVVRLNDAAGGRLVWPDDQGKFEFPNVADCESEVSVVMAARAGFEQEVFRAMVNPGAYLRIALGPTLMPSAKLSGVVSVGPVEAREAAIAVRIERITPGPRLRRAGDVLDGRFAFDHLVPGDYCVEVQPATWPVSWRTVVTVDALRETTVEFNLKGAWVTFEVDAAMREAVSGLVVKAVGEIGRWDTIPRNDDGLWNARMPTGTYDVRVVAGTAAPGVQRIIVGTADAQRVALECVQGIDTTLEIRGLQWDRRVSCKLIAKSMDGKFMAEVAKFGDPARWRLPLGSGVYEFTLQFGLETRSAVAEVRDAGGRAFVIIAPQ